MSLGISILVAIVGYFVLMFIGTNLIGVVVGGFVQPDQNGGEFSENIPKSKSISIAVIFCLLIIAYLFALYHYFNIGVVAAAVMLLVSRIPDSIYETKTGKKITMQTMSKGLLDIICNIIGWLALPMLWYSLYYLHNQIIS